MKHFRLGFGKTLIIAFIIVAFVGFFAGRELYKAAVGPTEPVRLLFAGDMMFDRTMRSVAEFRDYDALLSCVSDYTAGTSTAAGGASAGAFDLVIANLEGPITASASVSRGTTPGQPGNTTFTFDPAVAPALARANIRMVNLGNNHIYDFGQSGVRSTMSALDEAGISYFGVSAGANSANGDTGARIGGIATSTTINGYKIAFVNYNQFGSYMGDGASSDPEKVMQAIWKARSGSFDDSGERTEKRADFVVVYAHWGDEYVPENEFQRALAHRFIDGGADIVIGSHPHVIQGYEEYNGKPIYYSLGNFIFDQYWNEDVRRGLALELTIDTDGRVNIVEKEIEGTGCLF